jgi:hypothetical protein
VIGNHTLAQLSEVALFLLCVFIVGPHPSGALDRASRLIIDLLKPGGVLVLRDYDLGKMVKRKLVVGGGWGARQAMASSARALALAAASLCCWG